MTAWRQQINKNVVPPSSIKGLANGAFPASALVEVHDHDGNVVGHLCPEAARSWDAMVTAAWQEGVALLPTSAADTFRPLAVQKSIFADRYRTTNQGNGSRVCGGKRWYLRKGKATAACPGTSNHGLGLAVDFRRPTPSVLAWMENNAARFGWQWELASEEWHVHYMPGDKTPDAVHPHQEDDDMTFIRTPDAKVVLLHAGKLVWVNSPAGIDTDQNTWDLTKDPKTWDRVLKAYGPLVGS